MQILSSSIEETMNNFNNDSFDHDYLGLYVIYIKLISILKFYYCMSINNNKYCLINHC